MESCDSVLGNGKGLGDGEYNAVLGQSAFDAPLGDGECDAFVDGE